MTYVLSRRAPQAAPSMALPWRHGTQRGSRAPGSSTGAAERWSTGRRSSSRTACSPGWGGRDRWTTPRAPHAWTFPGRRDPGPDRRASAYRLTNVKDGSHSKDHYTRANLVEHLERSAYHGVAAAMSLGLEFDEALAFELRNAVIPNAARFLTSGRGIAATPMAGPQQEYRLGDPAWRTIRGGGARGGRRIGRSRGRHHQDLGRRPGRHGAEAGAGGLPGDHRRGACPGHAGGVASGLDQRAGRRQGPDPGGHRRLRPHGPGPRHRRRAHGAGPR